MAFQMGFPTLDINEIISAFSEMDVSITEMDLKQPKRENWEPLCGEIVCAATGCPPENLFQPQMAGLHHLSHPELHEKAITLFNINKAMDRILYSCGLTDYKISDITDPKPKRVQKICSAVINFWRFQDDPLKTYQRLKSENEMAAEQSLILKKENDEIYVQISALKAERAEKQEEIDNLNAAIKSVTENLQIVREEASQEQKKMAFCKQEMAEKKARLAKLKEDIAKLQEESNRLSGLIVPSPQRMKNEMERMKDTLQTLNGDSKERMQRLREYKNKKEMLEKKMKDSEQALKLISAINEQIQLEKSTQVEIGKMRDLMQSKKEEMREYELREQTMRTILQSKQDKAAKQRLQQESKIKSMQEIGEQLIQEKERNQNKKTEEEKEVHRINMQISVLVHEQERRKAECEDYVNKVKARYSALTEQVNSYHTRLGEAWESLKGEIVKSMRKEDGST